MLNQDEYEKVRRFRLKKKECRIASGPDGNYYVRYPVSPNYPEIHEFTRPPTPRETLIAAHLATLDDEYYVEAPRVQETPAPLKWVAQPVVDSLPVNAWINVNATHAPTQSHLAAFHTYPDTQDNWSPYGMERSPDFPTMEFDVSFAAKDFFRMLYFTDLKVAVKDDFKTLHAPIVLDPQEDKTTLVGAEGNTVSLHEESSSTRGMTITDEGQNASAPDGDMEIAFDTFAVPELPSPERIWTAGDDK
jgi:hypothetical protein